MSTKLDAILAALNAQNDAVSSLAARLNAIETGATPKTATPKTATPKTATPKTATPKAVQSDSDVTGTVLRVAASFKGIVLDNEPERWHNSLTPIFADLTVGELVTLHYAEQKWTGQRSKTDKTRVSKSGMRVVSWSAAGGQTPPVSKASSAPKTTASAPQDTEDGHTNAICVYCPDNDGKTMRHGKNANGMTAYQCLSRQYKAAGNSFDVTVPSDWLAFAQWIAATTLTLAVDHKGTTVTMNDKPEPDPTPETPVKRGRGRPRKIVSGGPAATATADAAILNAGAALVADQDDDSEDATASSPVIETEYSEGMHEGYVTRVVNTSGIIQLVNATHPGSKGKGLNVRAAGEKTLAKMAKASVGDRVSFKIGTSGNVVNFGILDTVASVSGVTPGIETSGKNAPAATKSKTSVSRQDVRGGTPGKTGKDAPGAALNASKTTLELQADAAAERAARRCIGCHRTMAKRTDLVSGKCVMCR